MNIDYDILKAIPRKYKKGFSDITKCIKSENKILYYCGYTNPSDSNEYDGISFIIDIRYPININIIILEMLNFINNNEIGIKNINIIQYIDDENQMKIFDI